MFRKREAVLDAAEGKEQGIREVRERWGSRDNWRSGIVYKR